MITPHPVPSPDNASLAAMLLELASQLHVERTRRIALEVLIERAGLLAQDAFVALGDDPAFAARAQHELDGSMQGLIAIMRGESKE